MPDVIRIDQNGCRNRANIFGQLTSLASQVADDKNGGTAKKTREALANMGDLLAQAGTEKSRLLGVQISLATMKDFDAMSDDWISLGNAPARCCGKVELADLGYPVEIITVAA